MCGLFGHTQFTPSRLEASRAALHTLSHRGPDQWGDWFPATQKGGKNAADTGSVYIGHRRLSIMDLSENGRQPMVSPDGTVVLTANGEIYNFQPLRAQLETEGYTFRSNSDSEVLLHGYHAWGLDALVDKLDGMFAVAIYDVPKRQLHLMCDHAGIKPLYWAQLPDGTLAWASELQAITHLAGEETLTTDATALYDFLHYRYIPAPKTMYQEVHKLLPAHTLTADLTTGQVTTRRYWDIPTTPRTNLTLESACAEVRTLIQQAVKDQLVSDVPVGFFLSGGIDSSVVVRAAVDGGTTNAHTCTIGFGDAAHNESKYAELVAKTLGTTHETRQFPRSMEATLTNDLNQLRTWYAEPYGDTSAFPTAQVCRLARETCTVVLSGDGGDELFGGYPGSVASPWLGWGAWAAPLAPFAGLIATWRSRTAGTRLGSLLSKLDRLTIADPIARYGRAMGSAREPELARWRQELGIPDDYDPWWFFRQHDRKDLPLRTRMQYLDFHTYLPGDILPKVDRVSMAVALEVRVPLLAKAVCEFALTVPESIRFAKGQLKGLLKEAYKGLLPEEILHRAKQGFSIGPTQTGPHPNERLQEHLLRTLFTKELARLKSGTPRPAAKAA